MNRPAPTKLQETLQRMVGWSLVCILVAGFVLTFCWINQQPRTYELLDRHFDSRAWDTAALTGVFSWKYDTNSHNNPFSLGCPDFFDFQHQALLRLLDLQNRAFDRPAPSRCKGGDFIDHSFAKTASRSESEVVVLGTGTLDPCHYDGSAIHEPDGYWQVERLTFTPQGRLLTREPFRYEDKQTEPNSTSQNL